MAAIEEDAIPFADRALQCLEDMPIRFNIA